MVATGQLMHFWHVVQVTYEYDPGDFAADAWLWFDGSAVSAPYQWSSMAGRRKEIMHIFFAWDRQCPTRWL